MSVATKKCPKCGDDKPATVDFFYKLKSKSQGLRNRDGLLLSSYCRECTRRYKADYYRKNRGDWEVVYSARRLAVRGQTNEQAAEYRRLNADKVAEAQRQSARKHPNTRKNGHLRRTYGISIDQYLQLVEEQQGTCAICLVVPNGKLQVDHDHNTGKVRRLLCRECNLGLGKFREDPNLLIKAARYLREHVEMSTSSVLHIVGGKA